MTDFSQQILDEQKRLHDLTQGIIKDSKEHHDRLFEMTKKQIVQEMELALFAPDSEYSYEQATKIVDILKDKLSTIKL